MDSQAKSALRQPDAHEIKAPNTMGASTFKLWEGDWRIL